LPEFQSFTTQVTISVTLGDNFRHFSKSMPGFLSIFSSLFAVCRRWHDLCILLDMRDLIEIIELSLRRLADWLRRLHHRID
jgi:hypothetical protein